MSQLRNLQLFRNDVNNVIIFTDSNGINNVNDLKDYIEQNIENKNIKLQDGEPIIIRYKENAEGDVKAIFGTGYVNGGETTILWTGEFDVNGTQVDSQDLVYINVTQNPTGTFNVTATTNTVDIDSATEENDGLVKANDVKSYVETAVSQIIHPEYSISAVEGEKNKWQLNKDGKSVEGSVIAVTIPEAETYTIAKLETAEDGFLATYELHDHSGNKVGASINIPKDFLVKSGSIVTNPEGQDEGKYIEFVINAKEGTATDNKIYINVNDLVDAYTAGNGIDITNANVVSVKYANGVEGNNVVFGTVDGQLVANVVLPEVPEYQEGSNITIGDDFVISAVDTVTTVEAGNGINVDTDEEDEHKYTISIQDDYVTTIVSNTMPTVYESNAFVTAVNNVVVHQTLPTFSNGLVKGEDDVVSIAIANNAHLSLNDAGELQVVGIDTTKIVSGRVDKGTDEEGHATATMYLVMDDESEVAVNVTPLLSTSDTYVSNVEIVSTEGEHKGQLHIALNDNNTEWYITLPETIGDAVVEYVDTEDAPDTIVVNSNGKFTQDVMDAIEAYIDNYNCGTFTL